MVKLSLLITLAAVSLGSASVQRNGLPILGAMTPKHLAKRFPALLEKRERQTSDPRAEELLTR